MYDIGEGDAGPLLAVKDFALLSSVRPRPAVFLDYDGIICHPRPHGSTPENIELIAGAADAVRRLNLRQIPVVVVSFQRSVADGYLSQQVVRAAIEQMHALLAIHGAVIEAVYCQWSGSSESGISALISEATAELCLDLPTSRIIGQPDNPGDLAEGAAWFDALPRL